MAKSKQKKKKKKKKKCRRKLQTQVLTSPIKWLRVLKVESRCETPHPSAPFSSLGNYICVREGGYVTIHDAYTLEIRWTSPQYEEIAFSADESLLGAYNFEPKTVTIYHWPSMKTLATFTGQSGVHLLQYVSHAGYFGALLGDSIVIFDTDVMEVRCLLQLESEWLTNIQWLDDLCVLQTPYKVYFWHAGGGAGPVRVNIESANQPIDLVSDSNSEVHSIRTVRESRSAEQQLAEEAEEEEEEEFLVDIDDEEYETIQRARRSRQKPADTQFRLMDANFMLFRGGNVVSSVVGHFEYAGGSRLDVWDTSTGLLVERRFVDRYIHAASECPDRQTLMLVVGAVPRRKNRWNVLQLRTVPSLDCIFQLPFSYQTSGYIELSPSGDLMILGHYSMYWCAVETSEFVWRRRRVLWIARMKHSLSVWSILPLPMFRKILMFI